MLPPAPQNQRAWVSPPTPQNRWGWRQCDFSDTFHSPYGRGYHDFGVPSPSGGAGDTLNPVLPPSPREGEDTQISVSPPALRGAGDTLIPVSLPSARSLRGRDAAQHPRGWQSGTRSPEPAPLRAPLLGPFPALTLRAGTPRQRDTGTQEHQDTGTREQRDTGAAGLRDIRPWPCGRCRRRRGRGGAGGSDTPCPPPGRWHLRAGRGPPTPAGREGAAPEPAKGILGSETSPTPPAPGPHA